MATQPIFRIVRKFKFVELTLESNTLMMHWGTVYQATGREHKRMSEVLEEKDLYLLWWAFTTVAPFSQQHNGLFRMFLQNGMLTMGLGRETDVENIQDYTFHGGRVMTYHIYDDTQNRVSIWLSPAECLYAGKMCEALGRLLLERRFQTDPLSDNQEELVPVLVKAGSVQAK